MALDADAIVDRRRLKRSRSIWRFAAIAIAIVVAIASVAELTGLAKEPHVARLQINGIILDDPFMSEIIERIEEDDSAKALLVEINSPGGTVTGAETLFDALTDVRAKKPVVAVMGSMAASGGYAAALPADHILAQRNTITGSIGVILQSTEISGLLDKIGVGVEEFKSAPLKGEPSMFHPADEAAREATQALIQDAYDWFVDLVVERRSMSREDALRVADGRVYSGRQAVENNLIDGLGDSDTARKWLADNKEISEDLPLKDAISFSDFEFLTTESRSILEVAIMALTGKTLESKRLRLDGLLAIWQP